MQTHKLRSTKGEGKHTCVGSLCVLLLGLWIEEKRWEERDKTCCESVVRMDEGVAEDKRWLASRNSSYNPSGNSSIWEALNCLI